MTLTREEKIRLKQKYAVLKKQINEGDYEDARDTLEFFQLHSSNPRVAKMIEQAKSAIDRGKKSQSSPEKLSTPSTGNYRYFLYTITALLIFIVGGYLYWSSTQVDDFFLELEWTMMCQDIATDVVIESDEIDYSETIFDAIVAECDEQFDRLLSFDREELVLCYKESDNGKLEAKFEDCTVENDVFINGELLGLAIINAE